MNCIQILQQFMTNMDLGISNYSFVESRIIDFNETNEDTANVDYSEEIVASTIIDSFKLNSENLKTLSDKCISKYKLQIGRRHKKILLKYLNYRFDEDKHSFFKEMRIENPDFTEKVIEAELSGIQEISSSEAFTKFKELWNLAIEENDTKKISDYLFGVYSKLHAYYNNSTLSNAALFDYNLPFIDGDLSAQGIKQLEDFCKSSDSSFYDFYVALLRKELQQQSLSGMLEPVMNQSEVDSTISNSANIYDRGSDLRLLLTEDYDAVYLRLNQDVYNHFGNAEDFFNYVLYAIQQAYRLLINNKVFSVEIDNIYDGNRNLKWLLYAYIGIYSERFICTKEERKFFSPDKICLEMMSPYGYSFELENQEAVLSALKKYYKKPTDDLEQLYSLLNTTNSYEDFLEFVKEWSYVYYGFTFNDCYVIKINSDMHMQFCPDVHNDNKLLFIFYKYRMDERKTPCPACNGLNVSGNSYPEVGHRSWECKNVICPSRSKSNRGKRYSFKTNYMQFGTSDLQPANIIPKEMIAKWRRDITSITADSEIYSMFIKYFSFPEEKVLFINANPQELDALANEGRTITNISLLESDYEVSTKEYLPIPNNIFSNYFVNGKYLKRFFKNKANANNNIIYNIIGNDTDAYIINGDSFEVLNQMTPNSVAAAVTSPPYFNAREYSQWENMYLYYIDMYNIARNTLNVLDTGGAFIYNIGDINGNEMTVAKSNMGNKRMLLGAYSILAFETAGYELVDNYIWDKGEPQSKRSTNDGNFTPHYQKPVNCYEHMFIFKRRGDQLHINANIPQKWQTYVTEFVPVYKINCHGENTLGHTAPYPEDIPDLASQLFGQPNRLILDPFLGSGTTIISATRNNYKGVGIEYSKEYAILSSKRYSEEFPDKQIQLM